MTPLARIALLAALPLALGLAPKAASPLPHCQIPCGIYGDAMHIDMMLEDAATIEKSMRSLQELAGKQPVDYDQIVRWTMNKDQHAASIQERVASYWLAQRIKAPEDEAGREKYLRQLEILHGITVAAMKCKQTTDPAWVEKLRGHADAFSKTYFSAEDLEHLRHHEDHGGGR